MYPFTYDLFLVSFWSESRASRILKVEFEIDRLLPFWHWGGGGGEASAKKAADTRFRKLSEWSWYEVYFHNEMREVD
jgi:hypothetical protein